MHASPSRRAAIIRGARYVSLDSGDHTPLEHGPAWLRFLDELQRFAEETTR